jgi:hypothetical protein
MAIESDWVLVLYGSCARGDSDPVSDRDVLLLADNADSLIDALPVDGTTLVCYQWHEFEGMREYGSLFLSHLALESFVLDGTAGGRRKFDGLTSELPPYQRVALDLAAFELAVADSREALDSRDSSIEFELASIGTVIRHAAILGCYLMGRPRFNRYEAVWTLADGHASLRAVGVGFSRLYKFRLAVARGYPMPVGATDDYARIWIRRAQLVIERVRQLGGV